MSRSLESNMPFPLETDRLRLRHFRDSDLESFLAYRNDPEVYRYQGWKVPYFLEYATEFIAEMKEAVPGTEGHWFQSALERKVDGVVIGDVAFFSMRGKPQQAYVGFTLARPYWNQGYASEAMHALIDFIFTELDLHRLVADCDAENVNSYHLLERLGFRREAHHVESYWLGDRWGDEYAYALLGREWRTVHK